MLTKHFYESDEVIGALRYCILQGRVLEMTFWIQELLESDMYTDAYTTLLELWLLYYSCIMPQWITYAMHECDIFELGLNLALCPDRDITPFAVLALQTDEVDRVKSTDKKKGLLTISDYYITALHQHRARSAWWATHTLGYDLAWNLLEDIYDERYKTQIQHIRIQSGIDNVILLCGAICYICLVQDRGLVENQWHRVSDDMRCTIERWGQCKSIRQRRVYSVPIASICGCGLRWSLPKSENTYERLNNLEESVRNDRQGYWWTRMRSAGYNMETCEWSSDDAKEAFYSTMVSIDDDIPDEWSLADKKKSHGAGMLRSADELISGGRWARCWLPTRPLQRGAWGLECKVQNAFADMSMYTTLIRQPFWNCLDTSKHIQPVQRQYVTAE